MTKSDYGQPSRSVAWGFVVMLSVVRRSTAHASVLMCGFAVCTANHAFAVSLEEIAEVYDSQNESLDSLRVEYRHVSEPVADRELVRKFLNTLTLVDEVREIAFKGEKRYSRLERPNNGVVEDLLSTTADNSPLTHRINSDDEHAYDGQHLYTQSSGMRGTAMPMGVVALPNDKDTPTSRYFTMDYLDYAFRSLPEAFGVSGGNPVGMANVIRAGQCELLERTEEVSGTPCVGVKWRGPAADATLWCDPTKGYAVLENVTRLREPADWKLFRVVNEDLKEVVPGVWLPQRCVMERFAPPKPGASAVRDTPLLRYTISVTDMSVNDIDDDMFTLVFAPGVLVTDERSKRSDGKPITYTIPADRRDLDKAISTAIAGEPPNAVVILPGRSSFRQIALGFTILLTTILFIIAVRRRLMKAG